MRSGWASTSGFLTPDRTAGILLLATLLILLLAVLIMVAGGATAGFVASLQGALADLAPHAGTFRLTNGLWTASWVVQLLGIGLLTRLLVRAGDDTLAPVAFAGFIIATVLGVLHGTFHLSVETWAAEEAARTGSIPAAYEPLRIWVSTAFRVAYITHLAATCVLGGSLLRTGLLPAGVGWAALGWGLLWLGGYLAGAGLPGILFIMPTVIGAALLWQSFVN